MELWDAYDSQGNKLGHYLIRGERIPEGEYHLVVEIFTFYEDKILITKRALNKEGFPGMYECTAGSAVMGEDSLTAAIRELKEETGLSGTFKQIYNMVSKFTIYVGFICKATHNNVVLQENETIDYLWIEKDNLIEFINKEEFILSQRIRMMQNIGRILEE